MNIATRTLLAVFMTLTLAGAAAGQTDPAANGEPASGAKSPRSLPFGVRAGYTNWEGVNQVHFGAHVLLGELFFPNFELTPSVELGLGDSWTILTVNGDFTYNFTELVERPWKFYAGGSLSFNYFNAKAGGSDTDLGLSALAGTAYRFANGNEGLVEIRFGIMDSPDFKLTFGYTLF